MIPAFGSLLTLAFLAEYLFFRLFVNLNINKDYLRYVAAGTGIALAMVYEVDILEESLDISTDYPVMGQIFTGLVLGRGANFAHDFYSRFLSPKKGQESLK